MANVSWGIDIGNRALKGVKLQRTAEGIKIVDYAFIEHDTILSEAGDNRDTLIQTALAKFVGRHDTRKTPVCVGVSGQQSFARFVKLPPVETKKIPEIVQFEAVQQIPFPLDEVEWSYQLFQRPDDPDIEVGIFAIRKELVNEQVGRFQEVDLDVHAVQASPLAVYNALRYDGRLDKGHAVIVDLGADSTDLIIADAESIWMRSLDIGGNNFTEALAKAFKIDFSKAEEMKRNAKTSKYAKQIYQAMRPVFGELVSEIQRSLGFFQSSHRDTKLRKVIATGGGFKLNGLSGYVQKNLQMPVEKPTKFTALPPDEAAAAAGLSEHVLSSMPAYGMALQLLEETKVTSSLLPTQIRKDKMWRDKTKYFVAAAGLVVGATFVAFGTVMFQQMAFNRASLEQSEVDRIIAEAKRLDSEWNAVVNDGSTELQQVKNVNSLVQDRAYWGQLLADLLSALPSPPPELASAFEGNLGEPGKIDEADVEAIKSIPRDERAFVKVEKIESLYSDSLETVVNASNFFDTAQQMLNAQNGGGRRGTAPLGGAAAGGAGAGATDPTMANASEPMRGYLMRITLTTPLPYEKAIEQLVQGTGAIPERLQQIGPKPGQNSREMPYYKVVKAGVPGVRPITDSTERMTALQRQYESRMALKEAPEAGAGSRMGGFGGGGMNGYPGMDPAMGGLEGMEGMDPALGGYPGGYGGYPGGYGGDPSGYGGGYGGYGGGYGGAYPGANRPSANRNTRNNGQNEGPDPALLDPITGESMLQDTEIQVVLAVQLDPPEPEAPAEDEFDQQDFDEQMAEAQ